MDAKTTAAWILGASFTKLESKINGFSDGGKKDALRWAREYFKNPDGNHARSKLATAVIGTLAPDEMDDLRAEPLD